MLIIHHTLHNNRKKVLIVRHTLENRPKNEILSHTHNGAMQIVASHFSFHEIATMLRRWWARPLRSVFSNATRLILPLLAVIRTKCDGL